MKAQARDRCARCCKHPQKAAEPVPGEGLTMQERHPRQLRTRCCLEDTAGVTGASRSLGILLRHSAQVAQSSRITPLPACPRCDTSARVCWSRNCGGACAGGDGWAGMSHGSINLFSRGNQSKSKKNESFKSGVQLDRKAKLWQEAYLTVLWVPSVFEGLYSSPLGLCLQAKRRVLNSSLLSSCSDSVAWPRLRASSARALDC